MRRRTYLAAVTALLGATAGCTEDSMSEEEARQQFDDVTRLDAPTGSHEDAVRCIDREAGVVLWAMNAAGMHAGEGVGMTAVPLKDTNLE